MYLSKKNSVRLMAQAVPHAVTVMFDREAISESFVGEESSQERYFALRKGLSCPECGHFEKKAYLVLSGDKKSFFVMRDII